jgi:AraC family transcriptional regulator
MVEESTIRRTSLLDNAIGLVESLQVQGPRFTRPRSESHSPDFQVCLPYQGAFVWHVGRDDVVGDPNRVLFVTGDEGFRISQPTPAGYAELIITLQPHLLGEILGVSERRVSQHEAFRARSAPASPALQLMGVECVHRARRGHWDAFASEEWLVYFLRACFESHAAPVDASPSTMRLLKRAKSYLAAHVCAPLRLSEVAAAVGTSPSYLTTIFRRLEGVPLHRYLLQLRLARALVQLPHAADLTTLACELGFSSHSHFTAAFRQSFGCTPSFFRDAMRQRPARYRPTVRATA